MKKIIFLLFAASFFSAVNAQTDTSAKKDINTMVELTNGNYDMGKISAGKPLEFNVYIKNISTDTLVIVNVQVGCGCTTPKYKKADTIAPGNSTFITLGFNGSAVGDFTKYADIIFKNGLTKRVNFHGTAVTDPPKVQ